MKVGQYCQCQYANNPSLDILTEFYSGLGQTAEDFLEQHSCCAVFPIPDPPADAFPNWDEAVEGSDGVWRAKAYNCGIP